MQLDEPRIEYLPSSQVSHIIRLSSLRVPPSQTAQTALPARATLPALHTVHEADPNAAKVPTPHSSQSAEPATEYRPAGQLMQLSLFSDGIVPPEQIVHELEFSAA